MSGSYGSLLGRYNTLYALYLQLLNNPSGVGTLQEVLDLGYTAVNKPINLTNTDATISSSITYSSIDTNDSTNGNSVTLTPIPQDSSPNTLSNLSPYTLQFSNDIGIATRYKRDGIQTFNGEVLDITTDANLTLQGISSTEGQVLTADALGKPVWSDLPLSQIPDLSGVLQIGAIASKSIDMNNFDITNIKSLDISTAPVETPILNSTRLSFPVTIDGVVYYLPLYSIP